jgi:small ligand-binding sensory domain FIST
VPVAAALSEHPLATHAVGECVGEVLEQLGPMCDLAVVFVTGPHAGALEDIAASVRSLLNPRVLLGATAVSVLGGGREVEDVAGISLWAARLGVDVEPLRLEAHESFGDVLLAGGATLPGRAGTVITVADPFSMPVEGLIDQLAELAPRIQLIGGLASAARGPGGNVLVLDDEHFRDGAIGVYLPPEVDVTPVVSQGCRPFGQPWTITRCERNAIYELAGQTALERLMAELAELDPDERAAAARGLHVGLVIDEHRSEFGRGDFLIRGVVGADREVGAVVIGADVEVGQTVQFQLRDAAAADEDLRDLMRGRRADGALVFTCNGRGSRLFGFPDHDAQVVAESIGGRGVGGMFCAGELGPVGGQNHLHGFTASIALFGGSGPT